jgi:hypothetical protein
MDRIACSLLAGLLVVGPAIAQDAGDNSTLDRIEVTGSRISYRDLLDTPAVSLLKSGDYLLQEVRLVNDTREATAREREIHETIAAMLAAGAPRYTVLQGDAYRVELNRGNYRIDVSDADKRPDTSQATLYVRVDLAGDAAAADAAARALQAFVRGVRGVGRTEVEAVGETALGMRRPERFRYEIIEAIARDTEAVTRALGVGCRVELDGLNSRIEWQRVSSGELLLYIPYQMTVEGCGPRTAG